MRLKLFKQFKKNYLKKFIKYYKDCNNSTQKKELKRSIYENTRLTEKQKEIFWNKVINNELDI